MLLKVVLSYVKFYLKELFKVSWLLCICQLERELTALFFGDKETEKCIQAYLNFRNRIVLYLELLFSMGLTLGVVSPDALAFWVVEPQAIRITYFGNFLCRKQCYNLHKHVL